MSHADTIRSLLTKTTPDTDRVVNAVLASVGVLDVHEVVEHLDGAGTPQLFLRTMPCISLTDIQYEDNDMSVLDEVKLVPHLGMIQKKHGVFPRGYWNIKVTYTAWYETIPDDLLWAIVALVEHQTAYIARQGITRESIDDYSVTFDNNPPAHIQHIFNKYKVRNV